MSARAAWRLESLGFTQVYRYTPGKADWFANGLPGEGTQAGIARAGDVARRDVPTCRLTQRLGEVRDRVRASGWDHCLVVNDERVVLGRLRAEAFDADPQSAVEAVMEDGPTTIRPDQALTTLVPHLQQRHVAGIIVSDGDGRLIGVLRIEDAERRLAEEADRGRRD